MSKRKSGRNVHGILLLDKRLGVSSNRALQEVRRLFDANKAGHTGSLDPLATGLLPLCFGEATKVSALMLDDNKRYQVLVQLGVMTDTGDAEGQIIQTRPVPELDRQARALARRLRRRFGDRLQVEVVKSEGRAGGGALPQASLPSRALALAVAPLAPQELEARLRQAGTPVIARVEHGLVLLDVRTLLPGDQAAIMAALDEVLADVK